MRLHSTTGERPGERFKPESITPLPELLGDCRDSAAAKVHSDFSIHFDGNTYSVPPWLVGKTVTARADHHSLTIYFKDKAVATHKRSWHRKQRVESAQHREAAQKCRHHNWFSEDIALLMSLGEEAKIYVERLAATQHPLKKNVARLLALKDEYDSRALIQAIRRALAHRAYGADYIENTLYQEMTPTRVHPPVRLDNREGLNRIRLQEPSLADYDALVVQRRNHHE